MTNSEHTYIIAANPFPYNQASKICVTGHTSGIGKALYDIFTTRGHDVIGYSRSTGHDFRDQASVIDVVDRTAHFDIFVNCVHQSQNEIARIWYQKHCWLPHVIINISSVLETIPEQKMKTIFYETFWPYLFEYQTAKKNLAQIHDTINERPSPAKSILVRAGAVDTPGIVPKESMKSKFRKNIRIISAEQFAKNFYDDICLHQPPMK